MILQILAKLAGEAMLSLYPVIVKLIHIPLYAQMWTRFSTYALISALFVDWDFIAKSVVSPVGWALMLVTLAHVYTSYEGFTQLESGVSYSIFYLYPIFILLLGREPISPWMLLALFGVFVLYYTNRTFATNHTWWGYAMIFGAAFTEALIYYLVRNLPSNNNWNHVFLSYILGAVGLSAYTLVKHGNVLHHIQNTRGIGLALGLNALIGMLGYVLRFYATSRLPPNIYAPLSYFGVFMAYVYGLAFGTDTFSWTKVFGTLCILASNFMVYKNTVKA